MWERGKIEKKKKKLRERIEICQESGENEQWGALLLSAESESERESEIDYEKIERIKDDSEAA